MQKVIFKPLLIWRLGYNRPICSLCGGMCKPSKLEQNKWICTGCNKVVEVDY